MNRGRSIMKKIIKFVSSIVIGVSMFTCVANASINNFDNRGFTYVDYTSGTYECTPYILGDFPICFEDKECSIEKSIYV